MPTLIHFDDCLRLLAMSRQELVAELSRNRLGVPLWHPLGFVSCTLVGGPDWALKVHLWPKGHRLTKRPTWPIHDHAYRIDSRILQGTIRNRIYSVTPGSKLELYSVDYENKASSLAPTGTRVDVSLFSSTTQSLDSRYTVELGTFHHSYVPPTALAASVVVKTLRTSVGPYVIGRPYSSNIRIPLYTRAAYPADVFWRLVLADSEVIDPVVGLEAGIVRLTSFNEDWVMAYEEEVARLRSLLGALFLASEHIGSTALPGVVEAKPIIDMMVAVPSMTIANELIGRLTEVGYVYRADGSLPDRVYFNRRTGHHDTHRDYLCAHPSHALRYRQLKRRLAVTYPTDRRAYTDGKAKFVYSTLERAAEEGFGATHLLRLS
jgi:GrpB-like predicted nucleotidyltransferase (UPF0157 family)